MNKQDYDKKVMDHIEEGPYQKVKKDPTKKALSSLKKCVGLLYKENKITKAQKQNIVPKKAFCPRLYGAPKIHKPEIPIRPIVDFRDSPTYWLAVFLKPTLQTLIQDGKYSIKNSYAFVSELQGLTISRQDMQVSFDVRSLFTKIPIMETLPIIRRKLTTNTSWKKLHNLSVDDVMKLLKLCIEATFFRFRDNFYKQTEGAAMGSPISPVIAEIYMQEFEETHIPNIPEIKNYNRYVDDSYSHVNKRKASQVLEKLNSIHPCIQFTMEVEEEGKLAFLDILIYTKPDFTFGHKIYRKPTHSEKYLNFKSAHPFCHKMSVVDGLVYRAYILCDEENRMDEFNHLRETLRRNNYPSYMLDNSIIKMKDRVKKLMQSTDDTQQEDPSKSQEKRGRLILPWYNKMTSEIASVMVFEFDVDIGYRPGTKIGQLVCKSKDSNGKPEAGIYKVPCKDTLCSDIYIGQSGRSVETRMKEHKNDVRNGKVDTSAVALHALENGHQIDFDAATLIEPETRFFHRLFKESLYIRKAQHTMNQDNGMEIENEIVDLLLPITKDPASF